MTSIDPRGPAAGPGGLAGAAPLAAEATRLREAARELEGIFLGQLFQAMRATVPQGEMFGGGQGQEMFTSMLDDMLAKEGAQRLEGGLGDALYRQLSRRLAESSAP